MKTRVIPVGSSPRLRAQDGPISIIELGMVRAAGANQSTLTGSDDCQAVRWVAPQSGTITSILPGWFSATASTPLFDCYMVAESGGGPFGAKFGDALGVITNLSASSGTFGVEATFTTPVANVVEGTAYWFLFVWRQGTLQLGYNPGAHIRGSKCWTTLSLADPIQSTVWRYKQNITIPLRVNWADGSQTTNLLGMGFSTLLTPALYGDPDTASGRFQGYKFKPKRSGYLEFWDVSWRAVYTNAATANGIEARLYEWGKWGAPVKTSETVIMATEAEANNSNRLGSFDWLVNPPLVRDDRYYGLVACQTGGGGGSISTEYLSLDGSATTNYTSYEPETPEENDQGFMSVSSTTGVSNLALDTSGAPYARIGIRELGR